MATPMTTKKTVKATAMSTALGGHRHSRNGQNHGLCHNGRKHAPQPRVAVVVTPKAPDTAKATAKANGHHRQPRS